MTSSMESTGFWEVGVITGWKNVVSESTLSESGSATGCSATIHAEVVQLLSASTAISASSTEWIRDGALSGECGTAGISREDRS